MPVPDFDYCDGSILYLTVEEIIEINREVIARFTPGEPFGVLKPDQLDSARWRPAIYRANAQTEDIFELASTLGEALVQYHCFLNANKRTAAHATAKFLLVNGYLLTASADDMVMAHVMLATHGISRQQYADILWGNSSPFDTRELQPPFEGC